jgi:hypothetical protein
MRARAAWTSLFPLVHFVLVAVCREDVVDILHKVDPPLYLLAKSATVRWPINGINGGKGPLIFGADVLHQWRTAICMRKGRSKRRCHGSFLQME